MSRPKAFGRRQDSAYDYHDLYFVICKGSSGLQARVIVVFCSLVSTLDIPFSFPLSVPQTSLLLYKALSDLEQLCSLDLIGALQPTPYSQGSVRLPCPTGPACSGYACFAWQPSKPTVLDRRCRASAVWYRSDALLGA